MSSKWKGNWEYRDSFSPRFGCSGTITVTANSKREAEEEIKDQASRQLLGSTIMSTYFEVSNVSEAD